METSCFPHLFPSAKWHNMSKTLVCCHIPDRGFGHFLRAIVSMRRTCVLMLYRPKEIEIIPKVKLRNNIYKAMLSLDIKRYQSQSPFATMPVVYVHVVKHAIPQTVTWSPAWCRSNAPQQWFDKPCFDMLSMPSILVTFTEYMKSQTRNGKQHFEAYKYIEWGQHQSTNWTWHGIPVARGILWKNDDFISQNAHMPAH